MNENTLNRITGELRTAHESIDYALGLMNDEHTAPVEVPVHGAGVGTEKEQHLEPDHLAVGRGAGAPGELVVIEVLAGSSKPIEGFGAFVGCDRRLELIKWNLAPEFVQLTNLKSPQAAVRQKRGTGIEGYLSLHIAFFGLIGISRDATDEEAAAERARLAPTRISAKLPPMTPVFDLTFRVPDDARPGEEIKLDNTPLKYGYYWRDPVTQRRLTQRLDTAFSVPKELGPQIKPQCVSGWVEVVAP